MKPLLTLFLVTASFASYAQQVEIPQKEFAVHLSDEMITLSRGENKQIDVNILKSKAYQKGRIAMGLSSSLPTGVTLSFNPEKGNADVSQATITALPEALPGTYSIIVNATINYKTKGSILKVTIR
jgi:uncharacterized membrane protein